MISLDFVEFCRINNFPAPHPFQIKVIDKIIDIHKKGGTVAFATNRPYGKNIMLRYLKALQIPVKTNLKPKPEKLKIYIDELKGPESCSKA